MKKSALDLKIQKEIKDINKSDIITLFNKPVDNVLSTNKRVLAIVGTSKNAGKTSFLNWLVKNLSSLKIAVTTTGRDGEDNDLVTGAKKPKLILNKDTCFTSFDYVANQQKHQLRILEKTDYRTIGKRLFIYKALENIETEVVGPSNISEQSKLVDYFLTQDSDLIIVDGSLDRKSICLSEYITDIILVIGASYGSLEEITQQARLLRMFTQFPVYDVKKYSSITYKSCSANITETEISSIYSNESFLINLLKEKLEWIYIPGAITDVSWEKIKNPVNAFSGKLLIENPVNLLIKSSHIDSLLKTDRIYSRKSFSFKAVIVNSFCPSNNHIDSERLLNSVREIFPDIPVTDISSII